MITVYDKPYSAADHDAISKNMLMLGTVKDGLVRFADADQEAKSLSIHRKTK